MAEVMRFPMSSALAGSELVFFRTISTKTGSKLQFYGGLTVVARTSCVVSEGEIPAWFAVDGRMLQPFVDKATQPVTILIDKGKNQIVLSAGKNHRSELPMLAGPEEVEKLAKGGELGKLIESDAQAINYLAELTPDMQIRPDLACVAIKDNLAVACGQRIVAKAVLDQLPVEAKLPALLVRNAAEGDNLFGDETSTTLAKGNATYAMPLPTETKKFPWDSALGLLDSPSVRIAETDGAAFAEACNRCNDCLGFVTKLGAFVEISGDKDSLLMVAQSGSVKYRTRVDATIRNAGLTMYLPINEAVLLAKLCTGEIHFSVGKKNKELHLVSDKVHVVVAAGNPEDE